MEEYDQVENFTDFTRYLIAFGPTVAELDISEAAITLSKTKFSMYLPEVVEVLKKNETKSILLLGIEVRLRNQILK